MLFRTEIYNVAQSLSTDSTTLYHGTKSNVIQRLEKSSAPTASSLSTSIIIELSPILRNDFSADTFTHLMHISDGYDPVDITCDRYFDNSLKNQTRNERGQGHIFMFDEHTKFPSDFKDKFLKINDNKERLKH